LIMANDSFREGGGWVMIERNQEKIKRPLLEYLEVSAERLAGLVTGRTLCMDYLHFIEPGCGLCADDF
jgi:hypothetical protein